MWLEPFLRVLGVEYAELWPDHQRSRLDEKAARLEVALRRRYDVLILRQQRIELLRERLRRAEQQLARLAQSGDPDHAQAVLERDERRLRHQECLYQQGLAAVAHLKRRLAATREARQRVTPRV
ncbi:MAG TPA: hypothetical protein VFA18_15415 [Gemmataceae bacterium]|nr:hypothetical protein [Gemmataceae bacterium]